MPKREALELVYADIKHGARAVLCRHPRYYMINNIFVPEKHRGKGIGRNLMASITRDADRDGITLALCVSSSGGLTDEDLHAWYRRCGFTDGNCIVLYRKPQSVEKAFVKPGVQKGARYEEKRTWTKRSKSRKFESKEMGLRWA